MIKIMILEDDLQASTILQQYIKTYCDENKLSFELETYTNAEDFVKNCDEEVNVLFMDIEMPGIDGMSAAKMIRAKNNTVIIVFVTNLAQYAIAGYEVGAYDFILKPVRYTSFSMKFQRILHEIEHKRNDITITVTGKEGIIRLYVSEILYVEVENHNVIIHTLEKNIKIRSTLAEFVELLEDKNFLLCNSCYLVNPKYIKKIVKDNVIVGSDVIHISRGKKASFLQKVGKYFGGMV